MPSTLWNHNAMGWQWAAVLTAALVAAVVDCRTMRIPNLLSGVTLVGGLIFATTVAGFTGIGDALLGMAVAALPFVLMFVLAGGGAGDAKLMGGIGAWLGTQGALLMLLSVMVVGGFLALLWAARRRQFGNAMGNLMWILNEAGAAVRGRGRGGPMVLPDAASLQVMPYGIAIFGGTCVAWGIWLWH